MTLQHIDPASFPESPSRPGTILVVGAAVLDRIFYVDALPGPGETSIGHRMEIYPGGKGANQALAARKMGANVRFISAVGEDEAGERALAPLIEVGVDVSGVVKMPGEATAEAVISVDAVGENQITACPGAYHHLTPDHLDMQREVFQHAGWLLVQNELPYQTVLRAIELAHEYRLKVVFNPDPYTKASVRPPRKIHMIIPNRQQAEAILGVKNYPSLNALQLAERWNAVGARHVVVTLGREGCEWFAPDGDRIQVPSIEVNAIDSVGAGDAFCGALTAFLAEDMNYPAALAAANAAAGLSVQHRGAQSGLQDRSSLVEWLRKQD